jgi:hypothetical protein
MSHLTRTNPPSVETTPFPQLTDGLLVGNEWKSCLQPLPDEYDLVAHLSAHCSVSSPAIFKAVWALILRRYSGAGSVWFHCVEKNWQSKYSMNLDGATIHEGTSVAGLIRELDAETQSKRKRVEQISISKIEERLTQNESFAPPKSILIIEEEDATCEKENFRRKFEVYNTQTGDNESADVHPISSRASRRRFKDRKEG